jgi:hypothetical protein
MQGTISRNLRSFIVSESLMCLGCGGNPFAPAARSRNTAEEPKAKSLSLRLSLNLCERTLDGYSAARNTGRSATFPHLFITGLTSTWKTNHMLSFNAALLDFYRELGPSHSLSTTNDFEFLGGGKEKQIHGAGGQTTSIGLICSVTNPW